MPSCKKSDIIVVNINRLKMNRAKQFYDVIPKDAINIIKDMIDKTS